MKDIQQAKSYYDDVLGIDITENDMGVLELKIAGSSPLMMYQKDNHQPGTFTMLNFPVDDIEQTVEVLSSKGIAFEQYGTPMKTGDKGIY